MPRLRYFSIFNKGWLDRHNRTFPSPEEVFNTAQNGLLMHPHLVDLWQDNVFAIDPDDNYRLVWFRDPEGVCDKDLLSCIPIYFRLPSLLPEQLGPDPNLLRGHLKFSLYANLAGYDIRREFSERERQDLMDEILEEDGTPVEMSDPLWNTRLGKFLYKWLLYTKLIEYDR